MIHILQWLHQRRWCGRPVQLAGRGALQTCLHAGVFHQTSCCRRSPQPTIAHRAWRTTLIEVAGGQLPAGSGSSSCCPAAAGTPCNQGAAEAAWSCDRAWHAAGGRGSSRRCHLARMRWGPGARGQRSRAVLLISGAAALGGGGVPLQLQSGQQLRLADVGGAADEPRGLPWSAATPGAGLLLGHQVALATPRRRQPVARGRLPRCGRPLLAGGACAKASPPFGSAASATFRRCTFGAALLAVSRLHWRDLYRSPDCTEVLVVDGSKELPHQRTYRKRTADS